MRTSVKRRNNPRLKQRYVYAIAVEGTVTEKKYFKAFHDHSYRVDVQSANGGDPKSLLKTMENLEKAHEDVARTEYWIVCDTEKPENKHDLKPLIKWRDGGKKRHLAVTCYTFEDYLLLHFQDVDSGKESKDILTESGHLCGSGKKPNGQRQGKDLRNFERKNVQDALNRIKDKGYRILPDFKDESVFCRKGQTSITDLVEKLLKEETIFSLKKPRQ